MGHQWTISTLTEIPNSSTTEIIAYQDYFIFSNDNNTKLLAAGNNGKGQLGIGNFETQIGKAQPITYFNKNDIEIKKICQNSTGIATYFISNKGQLYGCGKDEGLESPGDTTSKPKLITQLSNVIDAQSSSTCSIALCESNNSHEISIILPFWYRIHEIPNDLMAILISYTKSNTVYSSNNKLGSGHPYNQEFEDKHSKWHEIEFFTKSNINIIKIAITWRRSFFLDDTGSVWVCGEGRLSGVDGCEYLATPIYVPQEIEYFKENKIMIQDIQCGYMHY